MDRPSALLEAWRHACPTAGRTLVLPDGCRDLIAAEVAGQPTRWFVSPLADASYVVETRPETVYTGYRLRPGTTLDEVALLRLSQAIDPADAPRTLTLIDGLAHLDFRITEALEALALEPHVAGAARALGVSERSLERLLRRKTSRPPVYWKRLARLRRAAHGLRPGAPLAELAADHGFADQAHLTREFRRWLGATPARVQADRSWRHLLAQSGYGDPATGVQISTRKPSRSAT